MTPCRRVQFPSVSEEHAVVILCGPGIPNSHTEASKATQFIKRAEGEMGECVAAAIPNAWNADGELSRWKTLSLEVQINVTFRKVMEGTATKHRGEVLTNRLAEYTTSLHEDPAWRRRLRGFIPVTNRTATSSGFLGYKNNKLIFIHASVGTTNCSSNRITADTKSVWLRAGTNIKPT